MMKEKKFHLHDGKRGTALAVRIIPRARNNEIVEIMSDGTIKLRLASSPDDDALNRTVVEFLAGVLQVPPHNIEVVAGMTSRSKLISVIDLTASVAQARVLQNLA